MLKLITEIPTDKKISGVHCVPILPNGDLVMVWDEDGEILTTVGGRIEDNETISECLTREVMEEAGIEITDQKTLFASWYWNKFDSYRLFYLAHVKNFVDIPEGFETTGYIIMNFKTAIKLLKALKGREELVEVIKIAGKLAGKIKKTNNT